MSPEQTMVIEALMGIERELAEGDGSTYRERLSDDAVVVFPGKVLDKSSTVAAMEAPRLGRPLLRQPAAPCPRRRRGDRHLPLHRQTRLRTLRRGSLQHLRARERRRLGTRVPPADPAALSDGRPRGRACLDSAMAETVIVPARFNGPLANGNGGYSAGIAAAMLEGPVEATLRRPVPRPSAGRERGAQRRRAPRRREPDRRGEGGARVRDRGPGAGRPGRGRRSDVPLPRAGRGAVQPLLRLRAGPRGQLRGLLRQGRGARRRRLHLDPAELDRRRGRPRPARVRLGGARLPTFFGAYVDVEELPISFLGRITARIESTPMAGEEQVVMSWPLVDGRKAEAGVSLLSGGGEVLASARAMLIEAKGE